MAARVRFYLHEDTENLTDDELIYRHEEVMYCLRAEGKTNES